MNYLQKIRIVVRGGGWKESFIRSWNHLIRKILTCGDLLFDIRYGVNTCGETSILDLDIDNSLKSSSSSYEPSPVKVIRKMLEMLSINHPEFTFIDFGSGKGRVLLLASEYPYKRTIGVELSRSLHKTTQDNIRRWKSPSQKCFDIESRNMNAIEFELPVEPLVLFFFTPFWGPVFAKIVNKIRIHLKNNKVPIYILYYGRKQENIDKIRELNLNYKRINLKYTFSATGKFEAHLFFSMV